MMDDLNSIIDDFFMDTNMNRPLNITKFNAIFMTILISLKIEITWMNSSKEQEKRLLRLTNLGKQEPSKITVNLKQNLLL